MRRARRNKTGSGGHAFALPALQARRPHGEERSERIASRTMAANIAQATQRAWRGCLILPRHAGQRLCLLRGSRPNRDGAAYAKAETIVVEAIMAETITAEAITMGMTGDAACASGDGSALCEDGPADSQGAT
jgi:hypothetical protein